VKDKIQLWEKRKHCEFIVENKFPTGKSNWEASWRNKNNMKKMKDKN